jgi:hypothetical protein
LQQLHSRKENELSDAQEQWIFKLNEIDTFTDGRGKKIDAEIRETVAVLQLLGFNTKQSCEGHTDWGWPVPWVDIYSPAVSALDDEINSVEDQFLHRTHFFY